MLHLLPGQCWIATAHMIELGLIEIAKDAEGQSIYRDDEPVYRLTDKGQEFGKQELP